MPQDFSLKTGNSFYNKSMDQISGGSYLSAIFSDFSRKNDPEDFTII